MDKVTFNKADKASRLLFAPALRSFLEWRFRKEEKPLYQLDYVFCSDSFLLDLNKRFLGHDEFTDIITFDLSANDGIVGEVYISVDRVQDNSINLRVAYQHELRRVIFHGALHLLGYNDKTKKEESAMRGMEDEWLRQFDDYRHRST